MHMPYNSVLRHQKKGTYVTTLHAINSGIIKLSKHTVAATVYRGVSGGFLPDEFWRPNAMGVMGGVERAYMSTSLNRDVALGYMQQTGNTAKLLFEIRMDMVDRGTAVTMLSQFPGEQEILFAPLTGLELASRPRAEAGVIVIELRLNCNLHDFTLEQIVGRMHGSHVALIDGMLDALRHADAPPMTLQLLIELRTCAAIRGREFFNVSKHFEQATKEALEANAKALQALASAASWNQEVGSDVATRMRNAAVLLAREEEPEKAAALLVMAAEREPVSQAHLSRVRNVCANVRFQPDAEQQHALEALSMLLEISVPMWGLTRVALAELIGHGFAAGALALSHGQPSIAVLPQLFDEDATAQARKGSALLHAAAVGDAQAVTAALALPNVSANDSAANAITPLMLASHAGALAAVRALLEASADVNIRSKKGCTALGLAAAAGAREVIRTLLGAGAAIDDDGEHHSPIDARGYSPLLAATAVGNAEVVDILLDAQANANHASTSGSTALTIAVQRNDMQSVTTLLKERTAVDSQKRIKIDQACPTGDTALIQAAAKGHATILSALLTAGATVNTSKVRSKALLAAVDKGWKDCVTLLLEAHADVNYAPGTGKTPLMHAAVKGYEAIVERLLSARAEVNRPMNDGRTVLALAESALAERENRAVVVRQLEYAGAVRTSQVTVQLQDNPEVPKSVGMASELSKHAYGCCQLQ